MSRMSVAPIDPNALVEEFISTCDPPRGEEGWLARINDEVLAFESALADAMKEAVDVIYAFSGLAAAAPQSKVDQVTIARVKAIARLARTMFGEREFQEAFRRVHAANMARGGLDGRSARGDGGASRVRASHATPDLTDLV